MSENRDTARRKQRAAALSVVSNTVLVAGKLVVGLITGSVAVISEAVHSGMDLVAAVIALVAVTISGRPPDENHPHGHGKVEDLSGAVEALLIFGAVVFIGYESIHRIVGGGSVEQPMLGVAVMAASSLINAAVSWYLGKVGRETDSSALLADAAHLRTDVYTSMGVLVGLGLVHFTGLDWLDPAAALAVALLIVLEAWRITSRTVGELLDRGLPPEERRQVEELLAAEGISFHALRSRKSGPTRKLDLHLDVPPKATVEEVHALCDRLEDGVRRVFPGAQVLIHPEPMGELDRTSPAVEIARELLESHHDLFVEYHDLHAHEEGAQVHIALRLRLEPGTSVAELQRLIDHLTGHLRTLLPEVELYVHPEVHASPRQGPAPR